MGDFVFKCHECGQWYTPCNDDDEEELLCSVTCERCMERVRRRKENFGREK